MSESHNTIEQQQQQLPFVHQDLHTTQYQELPSRSSGIIMTPSPFSGDGVVPTAADSVDGGRTAALSEISGPEGGVAGVPGLSGTDHNGRDLPASNGGGSSGHSTPGVVGVPSEAELVLLCLDYLRDLRRTYTSQDLYDAEGIHADYLTVAIYSLSRCFDSPHVLTHAHGNDPFLSHRRTNAPTGSGTSSKDPTSLSLSLPCDLTRFPPLDVMTKEIVPSAFQSSRATTASAVEEEKRQDGEQEKDIMDDFEYDDSHASNAYRFYLLNGLASGPLLRGPLQLGEIVWAGLSGLQARSRYEAEQEMVTSPLFEQFVEAVKSKGFFKDAEHDTPKEDPNEELERQMRQRQIYDERFAKVVSKFRTKLASKAQVESVITSATEWQQARRFRRIEAARERRDETKEDLIRQQGLRSGSSSSGGIDGNMIRSGQQPMAEQGSSVLGTTHNPIDYEEAERLKNEGNAHMQKKEYEEAAASYTKALKLSPSGPNSHVYFSNRAAALLSMKRFADAILDSERSLALKPNYGKAHARLGLAHFLLGDYRQAMEAYTVALKYEPDNKSSKSYLEKAAKKLAADTSADGASSHDRSQTTSFSVVTEWEKGRNKNGSNQNPDYQVCKGGDGAGLPQQCVSPTGQNELASKHNQKEAEKYKVKGNSFMANRDYQQALNAYSAAIKLCPSGAQSHVYYSNRAAALCYLERYHEAESDSEQSLKLKPTYGKAHARLGLSRFFLNDFEGAIKAYTAALEYDPDNTASKSYLAKAKLKLERQRSEQRTGADTRRLLEDPEMHKMARKAMANPSKDLLNDPEMQNIARKALSDPTMMEAVMAASSHVSLNN